MTIELWSLGKQDNKELIAAIDMYCKRLTHYTKYKIETIDNGKILKSLPKEQIMDKEAVLILNKLSDKDILVTLDEHGESLTSLSFSEKLNIWMNLAPTKLIFLIGGSYGIASKLHARATFKISLSKFTFPHQLVRLLFTEQLYRAFTILKNEKYHHE
jgi:23S rRNA (pseudouridine1915-N3)-methyltransferase